MDEKISFIFTVRVDSDARFANIVATISYYSDMFPNAVLIVMEADTNSKLCNVLPRISGNIRYEFIQDNNPIFHRTHYINEEFRLTNTRYAVVVDSDIIVSKEQLVDAIEILKNNSQEVMVLPYDGRFIAVDDYYSDLFRQSLDISTLTTIQGNQTLMFGFISVGGIYVVDVAKYKECGWENENFLGWGPEDFEREHRLDILGRRPKRVSGVIYHLNHPRGVNSTNAIEDLAYSTKKEYCHVCSMLRPELISYIKTWIWVH